MMNGMHAASHGVGSLLRQGAAGESRSPRGDILPEKGPVYSGSLCSRELQEAQQHRELQQLEQREHPLPHPQEEEAPQQEHTHERLRGRQLQNSVSPLTQDTSDCMQRRGDTTDVHDAEPNTARLGTNSGSPCNLQPRAGYISSPDRICSSSHFGVSSSGGSVRSTAQCRPSGRELHGIGGCSLYEISSQAPHRSNSSTTEIPEAFSLDDGPRPNDATSSGADSCAGLPTDSSQDSSEELQSAAPAEGSAALTRSSTERSHSPAIVSSRLPQLSEVVGQQRRSEAAPPPPANSLADHAAVEGPARGCAATTSSEQGAAPAACVGGSAVAAAVEAAADSRARCGDAASVVGRAAAAAADRRAAFEGAVTGATLEEGVSATACDATAFRSGEERGTHESQQQLQGQTKSKQQQQCRQEQQEQLLRMMVLHEQHEEQQQRQPHQVLHLVPHEKEDQESRQGRGEEQVLLHGMREEEGEEQPQQRRQQELLGKVSGAFTGTPSLQVVSSETGEAGESQVTSVGIRYQASSCSMESPTAAGGAAAPAEEKYGGVKSSSSNRKCSVSAVPLTTVATTDAVVTSEKQQQVSVRENSGAAGAVGATAACGDQRVVALLKPPASGAALFRDDNDSSSATAVAGAPPVSGAAERLADAAPAERSHSAAAQSPAAGAAPETAAWPRESAGTQSTAATAAGEELPRAAAPAAATLREEVEENGQRARKGVLETRSAADVRRTSFTARKSGSTAMPNNSMFHQGTSFHGQSVPGFYVGRRAAAGTVECTIAGVNRHLLSSECIAAPAAAAAMQHPLMAHCAAATTATMTHHHPLSSAFSPAEEEKSEELGPRLVAGEAEDSPPATVRAAAASSATPAAAGGPRTEAVTRSPKLATVAGSSATAAITGSPATLAAAASFDGAASAKERRAVEAATLGEHRAAVESCSAATVGEGQLKKVEGAAEQAGFGDTGNAAAVCGSGAGGKRDETADETPKETAAFGEVPLQLHNRTEGGSACPEGTEFAAQNVETSRFGAAALATGPSASASRSLSAPVSAAAPLVSSPPAAYVPPAVPASSAASASSVASVPAASASPVAGPPAGLLHGKAVGGASAALAATRRHLQLLASADAQQMVSSLMHPRDQESRRFLQQVQQNSTAAAATGGSVDVRCSSNDGSTAQSGAAAEAEAAAGPAAAAAQQRQDDRRAIEKLRTAAAAEGGIGGFGSWPWRGSTGTAAVTAAQQQQHQPIGAASRFLRAFQFGLPSLRGSPSVTQEPQQQQQQQQELQQRAAAPHRAEKECTPVGAAAASRPGVGNAGAAGGPADAAAGGKWNGGITEFERLLEQQQRQRQRKQETPGIEKAAVATAGAAAVMPAVTEGQTLLPAADGTESGAVDAGATNAAVELYSGDMETGTHRESTENLHAQQLTVAGGVAAVPPAGAAAVSAPRMDSASSSAWGDVGASRVDGPVATDAVLPSADGAAAAGTAAPAVVGAGDSPARRVTANALATNAAADRATSPLRLHPRAAPVAGDSSSSGSAAGLSSTAAAPGVSSKPRTPYNVFLDRLKHPSCTSVVAAVRRFVETFPHHIKREEAARLLHPFLSQTQAALLQAEVFATAAAGNPAEQQHVMEGLERFVVQKLYGLLWRETEEDARENAYLRKKIACLRTWVQLHHLEVPPLENAAALLQLGKREIQRLDKVKCPRDKIILILNCCRVIIAVLDAARKATDPQAPPPAADDLLPLLIFVLLQARPPALHSHVQFIACFRHPSRLVSEEAYFFTHFCSAVEFIKAVGRPGVSLNVAADEYEAHMLRAEAEYLVSEKTETAVAAPQSAGAASAGVPDALTTDVAADAAGNGEKKDGERSDEVGRMRESEKQERDMHQQKTHEGGLEQHQPEETQGEQQRQQGRQNVHRTSVEQRGRAADVCVQEQCEPVALPTFSHKECSMPAGVAAAAEGGKEDQEDAKITGEKSKWRGLHATALQQTKSPREEGAQGGESRRADVSVRAVHQVGNDGAPDQARGNTAVRGEKVQDDTSLSDAASATRRTAGVKTSNTVDAEVAAQLSKDTAVREEITAPAALAAAASALSTLEHLSVAAGPSPTAADSGAAVGGAGSLAAAAAAHNAEANAAAVANAGGEGVTGVRAVPQRTRTHLEQYVLSPQEQQQRRRRQQEQQQQQRAALAILQEQLQAAPKTFRNMQGAGELRLTEVPLLLREYRQLSELVQRATTVIDQQRQQCDGFYEEEKKEAWWSRHAS